jgi:hypothetical protein
MKTFISSLCLVAALALSSSAHASVICEDEIRQAVAQGQSCSVENLEINTPEQTLVNTGSATLTCGSDTSTVNFAVSASPACKVVVFSNSEETAHVMQPSVIYPGHCGYAPFPCPPTVCNPRVRPCDAPPMMNE